MKRSSGGHRGDSSPAWAEFAQEELLDVRLCDLGLKIEGTALELRVEQLYDELERVGIRFRPHVWLSYDWFTPDGVTGFAIPFYLAHPRLMRLERRQMLQVEGATQSECMKIMRHEAGHALDNAYRLHWKQRWRETFGRFSEPYRSTYVPKPTSRHYVQNLDYWYSQSHPAEDYAETFAVWLAPGSRWRKRYRGWPAMKKLQCIDDLFEEVRNNPPRLRSRAKPESLPRLRRTLREHYERKKAFYAQDGTSLHDEQLARLFSDDSGYAQRETAYSFLRRTRRLLLDRVAQLTGQHRYVVDQALKEMMTRSKELGLRMTRSERESRMGAAVLLTVLTLNIVRGRPLYRR